MAREFRRSEVNEAFDLLDEAIRRDVWDSYPHGATLILANVAAGLLAECRAHPETWVAERRALLLAQTVDGR